MRRRDLLHHEVLMPPRRTMLYLSIRAHLGLMIERHLRPVRVTRELQTLLHAKNVGKTVV